MNWIGFYTIFKKEMERTWAVFLQAVLSPVITTTLYFVVFGAAIGSQIDEIGGVRYIEFIIPGLIMMSLIPNAFSAASSGIYFQKFIGSITDLLTAPLSYIEIASAYALAAMSRAIVIGAIIYGIAFIFTSTHVAHPLAAIGFSMLVSLTFAVFGLVIGLWAKDFEQLSFIPTIIIMPLSFLGGVFYAVEMLPPFWQNLTLANPVYYMVDGLRWAFLDMSHSSPMLSFAFVCGLFVICIAILGWMFRTGYKIKS